MPALPDWDSVVTGDGCPLCQPRKQLASAWAHVADLAAATLYLHRNQVYRGHCMLVFNPRHETRLEALPPAEFSQLMGDLRNAAAAVVNTVDPDHVNYASLGNEQPHLHWHIIPRYRSDPRWRQAIWAGDRLPDPVTLPEDAFDRLRAAIAQGLA